MYISLNIKTFIEQCGETWTVKCMPTVSIVSIFGLKNLYKWWYEEIRQEVPLVNERLTTHKNIAMRVQVNNRLVAPNYYDIRNLPSAAKEKAEKDIDFIIANYSKYFQIQKEILFLNDVKKQLSLEPNFEFSKTIESLDKFDKVRNNSWRESLPELARYTNV
mgnify:FL=1